MPRLEQFCEKQLKEYKGRICVCMVLSHTHRQTDTGQKFCPTKKQFELVMNFTGDRGEARKAENSPSGFADERYRKLSNSSFCKYHHMVAFQFTMLHESQNL